MLVHLNAALEEYARLLTGESSCIRVLKIRDGHTQFVSVSQNMRQVIMYRDENGYWIVECPSLRGCVSQGKTKEAALTNIKEAIAGYVAALEEDGLPVPQDNFETFLIVVWVSYLAFQEEIVSRLCKKSVSTKSGERAVI